MFLSEAWFVHVFVLLDVTTRCHYNTYMYMNEHFRVLGVDG